MSHNQEKIYLNLSEKLEIPCPIVCDIEEWGLLEIHGPDAEKFLQGQVTCDIRQLAERSHLPGAFCNPKGRVLATFTLFAANEAIYLRMPRDLIPGILTTLQKYAVFFNVSLAYRDEYFGLALLINEPIEDSFESDCLGVITEEKSLEFWGTKLQLDAIKTQYQDRFVQADPAWWKLHLIQRREAQIFALTTEQFLAHQLSLDLSGAISFRKGCYTGQEIIARTQYRGKSKKRLAIALIEPSVDATSGAEILKPDQTPFGHILCSISDANGTLIQAVLPEDMETSGRFILNSNEVAYRLIPATGIA